MSKALVFLIFLLSTPKISDDFKSAPKAHQKAGHAKATRGSSVKKRRSLKRSSFKIHKAFGKSKLYSKRPTKKVLDYTL